MSIPSPPKDSITHSEYGQYTCSYKISSKKCIRSWVMVLRTWEYKKNAKPKTISTILRTIIIQCKNYTKQHKIKSSKTATIVCKSLISIFSQYRSHRRRTARSHCTTNWNLTQNQEVDSNCCQQLRTDFDAAAGDRRKSANAFLM